jgi:glycosyltransferase involved in cell wall biosynthesis
MMAEQSIQIAVLMPAFNPAAHEIKNSLASLEHQGVPFRLFIVDDGSDVPVETLLPQTGFPVTCIQLAQNQGIVGALNAGLAEILRDPDIAYIARLDVADMMQPDRLKRQMAYLSQRPRMGMCGTDAICQEEDGTFAYDYCPGDDPSRLKDTLKFTNPITHSSVMIKRHVIDELGVYRDGFVAAEDYELWCRIAERYDIGNVPELLTVYIVQPNGISLSKPTRQLRGRLAVQRAYFSPLDLGDIKGMLRTMLMLTLPVPMLNRIKIAIRGYL